MTETTELPTLSVGTQTSVQGLVRAKHEVEQWTRNLEQALADDVAANPPRLTPELAATVAKTHGVKAPPAPGSPAEAKETTAEANQAQLDAQTKTNAAEAAKTAAPAHHPNQERENRERAEHERRVAQEQERERQRAEQEERLRAEKERREKAERDEKAKTPPPQPPKGR
ncbi:MAG TPA: hypothetical protein VKQ70_06260 [Caulobacteraceae bacterium]|nr:hypothetical protein [Caulobacteraceae bacterium]